MKNWNAHLQLRFPRIMFLCAQIGQILDVVENSGVANDTLVMLSSDHGGRGRYHGRFQDDDLMIPMFVKGISLLLFPFPKLTFQFSHFEV